MASETMLRCLENLRCEATRTTSGQVVHTDVPTEHGGQGEYYSPVELLSVALAACVSSVLGVVARRNGVDLIGLETQARLEMVSTPVRRLGSVQLIIRIPRGQTLSEAIRAKLEAAAKACPVKNSLHPDIRVELEFVYEDAF